MPIRKRKGYSTSGDIIGGGAVGVALAHSVTGIGRPGAVRLFADVVVPSDDNNNNGDGGSQVAVQEFSFYPYGISNSYLNGSATVGEFSVRLDAARASLVNSANVVSSRFSSFFSKAGTPDQGDQAGWDPDIWTLLHGTVANGHQIGDAAGGNGVFAQVAAVPVVTTGDVFRLGNLKHYANTFSSAPFSNPVNGYAVGDIARVIQYNSANYLGFNRLGAQQPGCLWMPSGSDIFTVNPQVKDGALTWAQAISLFQSLHSSISTQISWVSSAPYNASVVGAVSEFPFLTLEQVNQVASVDQGGNAYGLASPTHVFTFFKLLARKTSL